MVGHAFVIAMKSMSAEPSVFLHYNFSYLAVNVFFITSGFLVTKSMAYRGDMPDYFAARALRIYPALIVHLLFVMFVIGAISTILPLKDYFLHSDVWKQPFLVLPFINTDVVLPGVFTNNLEPFASVPLWTLRYELLAYIGTATVFSLGLLRRKWMVLAQFILPSIAWIVTYQLGILDDLLPTLRNAIRFGIAYGLGATLYAYRDRVSFSLLGLAAVLGLTLIAKNTASLEVFVNILLAYGLMLLAYARVQKLNILTRISDISYGVYIYHWCMLQIVFEFMPNLSPIGLLAIAAPLTFIIASLSWHWVEKPILKQKSNFARLLRFGASPDPLKKRRPVLLD